MSRKWLGVVIAALLLVCMTAALGWTLQRHVVRSERGVIVLEKRFLTFRDSFVDIRQWQARDFSDHPDVRRALIAEGYADLVIGKHIESAGKRLRQVGQEMQGTARAIGDEVRKTVDDVLEREKKTKDTPE